MKRGIGLQFANEDLTTTKEGLEASNANKQLERPYDDRIKALNAQLEGVRAKMGGIGASSADEAVIKAYTEAVKVIEEVNKALEKNHTKLTEAQMGQITLKELQIAQIETESKWKQKLDETNDSIADRIKSTELLTAAIGKGYTASRAASVETSIMGAVGHGNYNDPRWMQEHAGDVSKLRSEFTSEYEAQHGEQVAQAVEKLKEEISLERALAQVQTQGAQAARDAGFAFNLAQMKIKGATAEQIQAEMDLYSARRANLSAENIAKLDEQTAAVKRLAAADLQGAEAVRKSGLENKYAEMARGGASAAEIQSARGLDAAQQQQKVTEEALK